MVSNYKNLLILNSTLDFRTVYQFCNSYQVTYNYNYNYTKYYTKDLTDKTNFKTLNFFLSSRIYIAQNGQNRKSFY